MGCWYAFLENQLYTILLCGNLIFLTNNPTIVAMSMLSVLIFAICQVLSKMNAWLSLYLFLPLLWHYGEDSLRLVYRQLLLSLLQEFHSFATDDLTV